MGNRICWPGILGLLLLIVLSGCERQTNTSYVRPPDPTPLPPGTTYADVLDDAGFPEAASRVRKLTRPCLTLVAADSATPNLGGSRIGGTPDLPPEISWPKTKNGSMTFVAQINLSETPALTGDVMLPPSGFLYFFYDEEEFVWGMEPGDKEYWRVLYSVEPPDKLKPTSFPQDLDKTCLYEELRVTPVLDETQQFPGHWDDLDWGELDEAIYDIESLYYVIPDLSVIHQMLGFPREIQDDVRYDCLMANSDATYEELAQMSERERKDFESTLDDWVLLLQVDSDDRTGMMWGDVGRLYFMITRENLRNKRFEETWMALQCY